MSGDVRNARLNSFLNCEMEFECPKNWFELTDTDKAGIKRCSTCDRNVHLCVTQDEVDELSLKGECIAFFRNQMYKPASNYLEKKQKQTLEIHNLD